MSAIPSNPCLPASYVPTPLPKVQAREQQRYPRIIGPIPPRGADGRLQLEPVVGDRLKTDRFGFPVYDDNGNAVEEKGVDLHDPREYCSYDPGQRPDPKAIAHLKLWECQLRADAGTMPMGTSPATEPLVLLFAKSADDARRVFIKEMGIISIGEGNSIAIREIPKN